MNLKFLQSLSFSSTCLLLLYSDLSKLVWGTSRGKRSLSEASYMASIEFLTLKAFGGKKRNVKK
jgi:hypothetical protein